MLRGLAVILAMAAGCRDASPPPAPHAADPDPVEQARWHLVDDTIAVRSHFDDALLDALRVVPRDQFVPPDVRDHAYEDRALPIGFGLTISQPSIVAMMTQAAAIRRGARVLEIGTGSGYQAAVLAELGARVYSIEINADLARRTRAVLDHLGFDRIQTRTGDGYNGWPEAAPFDAILVTCATRDVPPPLIEQLAIGGKIVIPLGDEYSQTLEVITRAPSGTREEELMSVRFGPMLGRARDGADDEP